MSSKNYSKTSHANKNIVLPLNEDMNTIELLNANNKIQLNNINNRKFMNNNNNSSMINSEFNPNFNNSMQINSNYDNKDYNRWLNILISFLRDNHLNSVNIKHLKKHNISKEIDFKNREFLEYLRLTAKISFNPANEMMYLIKKYDIKSKNDLILLLKREENGLKYDDDLKTSYLDIDKDIEELKNSKKINVIQSEKDLVLFYRDPDDEVEKMLVDTANHNALNLIRDIWKNECKFVEITKPEMKIDLSKENEFNKVSKKKRKRTKIKSNTHLLHLLNGNNQVNTAK